MSGHQSGELVATLIKQQTDLVSVSITPVGHELVNRADSTFFATSEPVGEKADLLVPLTLLPAMVVDSALKLRGEISQRALSAVPTIQDIYCLWEERFLFPPQRIPIFAEARNGSDEQAAGVGCFFSGGVDSFYTLLKNRDKVTHLIFVHGFDIDLTNDSLRKRASNAAREVARELGKSLIEVKTNLRSFSDQVVDWRQYHGAALASVGLLFQHMFREVLIPGTFTYADLSPWGSHPLLDPLWSTDQMKFMHDGGEATRVEKAAYISRYEVAMRWLRVCWMNPDLAYNCGQCGKCLLTMAALRTVGSLERCKTLPHTLALKKIPHIDRINKEDVTFIQQNLKILEMQGTDPDLARALERAVQPPALYPRRRYRLGNILMERTIKLPGARKLVRRGPRFWLREVLDPEEWNAAVKDLGGGITQSWEWGLFQQRMGLKPLRLLDEEGGGGTQVLLQEQRGGFSVAYIPYGPLTADTSDLPELTEAVARKAHKYRAYLLKIDPRWNVELGQVPLGVGRYVRAASELPDSTLIVDVLNNSEEQLKSLPGDTRRRIQNAHEQGVEVEKFSSGSVGIGKGIAEFLDLLEDTSKRQGFQFAHRAFYEALMRDLDRLAHLVLARLEGRLRAGAIVATFGDETYYLFGAFRPEEEGLRALDVVHWQAIDIARRAECSRYDMWGTAEGVFPAHWPWALDPSKKSFGGTLVRYAEAHIRILSYLQLYEQSALRLGVKGEHALRELRNQIFRR
jgi:lipid II:glycine glycyltransferase (peptidoglycan interpeptide bridge formation enzyme)